MLLTPALLVLIRVKLIATHSQASTGSVQYVPDKSAFVWKIKQLGGGREFLMRAHFGLPSVRGGTSALGSTLRTVNLLTFACLEHESLDKRAPITVKFEIPYFTVSGIQVRYLKIVEKSGYQALPWVRYITQNGDDYRCVSPCLGSLAGVLLTISLSYFS